MLGNLKVHNSDSGNVLISLKQDIEPAGAKNSGSDFYSMVVNQVPDNVKNNEPVRTVTEEKSVKENFNEKPHLKERTEEKKEHHEDKSLKTVGKESENGDSASNDINRIQKVEEKSRTHSADNEKSIKANSKDKKNSEIDEILQMVTAEHGSNKLTEMVRSAVKGDIIDFEKKFKKLTEEFFSLKKGTPGMKPEQSPVNTGEKVQPSKDTAGAVINDFVEKLGRELSKIVNLRKGDEKRPVFSDKELKETIGAIIDDIKKLKNREYAKNEVRKAESDEKGVDKKNDIISETQSLKKKESGAESGFDSGAGKEKNSSRDNNSFSSSKTDTFNKAGFEKSDSTVKSPEFRQSLQEIIDKAKITVRDSNNGSFAVKLFPKELGSVNINLIMENGIVSGKFLVDSDEAKNLLLNNLSNLKDQLSDAGISVGEFSVNVSDERERFAAAQDEDDKKNHPGGARIKSETAIIQYDSSSTASHNGHINMVI